MKLSDIGKVWFIAGAIRGPDNETDGSLSFGEEGGRLSVKSFLTGGLRWLVLHPDPLRMRHIERNFGVIHSPTESFEVWRNYLSRKDKNNFIRGALECGLHYITHLGAAFRELAHCPGVPPDDRLTALTMAEIADALKSEPSLALTRIDETIARFIDKSKKESEKDGGS